MCPPSFHSHLPPMSRVISRPFTFRSSYSYFLHIVIGHLIRVLITHQSSFSRVTIAKFQPIGNHPDSSGYRNINFLMFPKFFNKMLMFKFLNVLSNIFYKFTQTFCKIFIQKTCKKTFNKVVVWLTKLSNSNDHLAIPLKHKNLFCWSIHAHFAEYEFHATFLPLQTIQRNESPGSIVGIGNSAYQ